MSKLLRAGVTSCAAILLVAMLTTPATARIECRGNFQMTQYGPDDLLLRVLQGGLPTLVFSTIEGGRLSPDNLSRDWARTVRRLELAYGVIPCASSLTRACRCVRFKCP